MADDGLSERAFPAQMEGITAESPSGNGGQALLDANGDYRALRAWKETKWDPRLGVNMETGRSFIDVTNAEGKDDVQPVANATLRKDEWEMFDEAVQTAGRDELVGIKDLESRNLTFDIGDGLGVFNLTYEERTAVQEAFMDMTGEERGETGGVKYTQRTIPIPLIYSHFRLNMRRVLASRRGLGSEPIDTVMAEEATDNINEKKEDLLFGSTSYSYGGNTVHTYLSHPNTITATNTAGDWNDAGVDTIINDVREMKQAMRNKYHRGPFVLYVPAEMDKRLDEDYSVSGQSKMTLYQRLLQIRDLEDVKTADRLADGNALLVEMRRSNVRLVRGMDLNPVQWNSPSGMAAYFQVMTIRIPQIRQDANGYVGVVHLQYGPAT